MAIKKELPVSHITDAEHLRLLLAESYRNNDYLQQQVDELKRKRFWHFNNEECWAWDSDGNNYIDSLFCPIVISAQDMKDILGHAKEMAVEANQLAGAFGAADYDQIVERIENAECRLMKCFKDESE